MKDSTDIVIHVNEKMDSQRRERFSNNVRDLYGVVSADIKDIRPHLMIVAFNRGKTKAVEVINGIKKSGVEAQLVSWL